MDTNKLYHLKLLRTCIGPAAKPSLQLHSNPPTTFVQVPFPQMFWLETHSLSSTHFRPVESRTYPWGHSHRKEPSVLTQSPPLQISGIKIHSFKSFPVSILPKPSGHNLANSTAEIKNVVVKFRSSVKRRGKYLFLL